MTNTLKRVLDLERLNPKVGTAASGYTQLGETIIQFGTEPGGANPQTINLPTAFASATYSVICSPATPAATGTAAQVTVNVTAQTDTTFDVVARDVSSSADADSASPWNWIAIGLAP